MNITHRPEGWVIIKIGGPTPHYRVFAGWYGGYLSGDSWRMNSGITKVTKEDEYFLFAGDSGSLYQCHESSYGRLSSYNISVLQGFCEKSQGLVEYFKEMPDMLTVDLLI